MHNTLIILHGTLVSIYSNHAIDCIYGWITNHVMNIGVNKHETGMDVNYKFTGRVSVKETIKFTLSLGLSCSIMSQ